MNHEIQDEIHAALQPLPADREPSTALMSKLRTLAHETPIRTPWWRARALVPVGMAGVVAAAVVAATLLPAKAEAKTFGRVVAAAQRINAFQFSILSDEGGKRETFTIAGSDGHVAMRAGEGTLMQIDPGTMSIYDPTEKKITRFKFGSLVDAPSMMKEMSSGIAEGLKEMDLKKMLQEYQAKYGTDGVTISPVTEENGQRVYHIALASRNEPERVEITVDDATDLPIRLQVDGKDGDGKTHTDVVMEMRFGDRIDPSLLRTSFPADAKVEEIDLGAMASGAMKGLEDLGKSLDGSGGGKKK